MWSKTKVGLTLGALVLTMGIGSVFAQEAKQPTTDVKQHVKIFGKDKGHKGMHQDIPGKRLAPWENQELLTLLSLDATVLKDELKAGKSLADLAQAKNVPVEKVVELLVKQHEDQLETAVKDGKLTQVQATKWKEKMKERVTNRVNNTHSKRDGIGKGWGKVHGLWANEELLALLKLNADQLHTEWKAGKSLAEIAAAQGVAREAVITVVTKQFEIRLNEAMKAGKLTQEKVAELKTKQKEFIEKLVDKKFTPKNEKSAIGN